MNDASVRPLAARGGFGDEFQIRGLTLPNGDLAINGLYGLAPSTRIPLESIERVEVLKGPGALTNGVGPSGSVGGSINTVLKRAGDVPLTRLTTTFMSQANLARVAPLPAPRQPSHTPLREIPAGPRPAPAPSIGAPCPSQRRGRREAGWPGRRIS